MFSTLSKVYIVLYCNFTKFWGLARLFFFDHQKQNSRGQTYPDFSPEYGSSSKITGSYNPYNTNLANSDESLLLQELCFFGVFSVRVGRAPPEPQRTLYNRFYSPGSTKHDELTDSVLKNVWSLIHSAVPCSTNTFHFVCIAGSCADGCCCNQFITLETFAQCSL